MKNDDANYMNETANTGNGLKSPLERENLAATDMISELVEEIVDNVQEEFQDDEDETESK